MPGLDGLRFVNAREPINRGEVLFKAMFYFNSLRSPADLYYDGEIILAL